MSITNSNQPSDAVDPNLEPAHRDHPPTTLELFHETLEVLKGEGAPVSQRAPVVPFLVVFLSYFFVLAAIAAVVSVCLMIFR